MTINLVKLNRSIYLIEKEETGEGKEIIRQEGETKEEFLNRVKKTYDNVKNLYKELKGKEVK